MTWFSRNEGVTLPQAGRACPRPAAAGASDDVVIELVAQSRLAERGSRIDQDVGGDRLAADQHAVGHGGAVGERDLDRPLALADADRRLDDVAVLALAVGAGHLAPVLHTRGADDL